MTFAHIPDPAPNREEALARLRAFCSAVHTMYDEEPEPEGLIIDSATDFTEHNEATRTGRNNGPLPQTPTRHLLLADLELIAQGGTA